MRETALASEEAGAEPVAGFPVRNRHPWQVTDSYKEQSHEDIIHKSPALVVCFVTSTEAARGKVIANAAASVIVPDIQSDRSPRKGLWFIGVRRPTLVVPRITLTKNDGPSIWNRRSLHQHRCCANLLPRNALAFINTKLRLPIENCSLCS